MDESLKTFHLGSVLLAQGLPSDWLSNTKMFWGLAVPNPRWLLQTVRAGGPPSSVWLRHPGGEGPHIGRRSLTIDRRSQISGRETDYIYSNSCRFCSSHIKLNSHTTNCNPPPHWIRMQYSMISWNRWSQQSLKLYKLRQLLATYFHTSRLSRSCQTGWVYRPDGLSNCSFWLVVQDP